MLGSGLTPLATAHQGCISQVGKLRRLRARTYLTRGHTATTIQPRTLDCLPKPQSPQEHQHLRHGIRGNRRGGAVRFRVAGETPGGQVGSNSRHHPWFMQTFPISSSGCGDINLGAQLQTGSCDLNATKIDDLIPGLIGHCGASQVGLGVEERQSGRSWSARLGCPCGGSGAPGRPPSTVDQSTDSRARVLGSGPDPGPGPPAA